MLRLRESGTARLVFRVSKHEDGIEEELLAGVVLPVEGGYIAQRRVGDTPQGPVLTREAAGPIALTPALAAAQLATETTIVLAADAPAPPTRSR